MALADLRSARAVSRTGRHRQDANRSTAWPGTSRSSTATADLVFEGDGLRISRIEMTKGPARVTGDALIGWNNTYVFSADGRQIPVESLANFKVEKAPLSGMFEFKARGEGRFDAAELRARRRPSPTSTPPTKASARSYGKLSVKDDVLTIDRLDARLEPPAGHRIGQHRAQRALGRDAVLPPVRNVARSVSEVLRAGAVAVHPRHHQRHGGRRGAAGRSGEPRRRRAHRAPERAADALRLSTAQRGRCAAGVRRQRLQDRPAAARGQDTLLDVGGISRFGKRDGATSKRPARPTWRSCSVLSRSQARTAKPNSTRSIVGPFEIADAHAARPRSRTAGCGTPSLPHGLIDINGPIRVEAGRISVDGITAVMGEGPVRFGGAHYPVERLPARGIQPHGRRPVAAAALSGRASSRP